MEIELMSDGYDRLSKENDELKHYIKECKKNIFSEMERCNKCSEKETPCLRCLQFEYNKRQMLIIEILEAQGAMDELVEQAQDLNMGYSDANSR